MYFFNYLYGGLKIFLFFIMDNSNFFLKWPFIGSRNPQWPGPFMVFVIFKTDIGWPSFQTWNFELLPPAIRNNWWMLWIFEYFFNFYYDANFFQNCQITFPKTELVSLLWCVSGKDRAVGSELNNSIYNKFLPILVTFSSFLWFESSCDSWIRFSVSLSIPHLLF